MPIELKGNNYYSKVFKRVNYELSNRTFLVVITRHSSFHPGKNSVRRTFQLPRSDMSGSSDRISHIRRLTPDGRGGRFNFLGQACPDPLVALTPSDMHSCSVLPKLPDISDRLFEIFCFRYLLSKSPNSPCNPPII